jgi:hypothetical protein
MNHLWVGLAIHFLRIGSIFEFYRQLEPIGLLENRKLTSTIYNFFNLGFPKKLNPKLIIKKVTWHHIQQIYLIDYTQYKNK